jgi:hypothetical protein
MRSSLACRLPRSIGHWPVYWLSANFKLSVFMWIFLGARSGIDLESLVQKTRFSSLNCFYMVFSEHIRKIFGEMTVKI